jgi:hypothetical protein
VTMQALAEGLAILAFNDRLAFALSTGTILVRPEDSGACGGAAAATAHATASSAAEPAALTGKGRGGGRRQGGHQRAGAAARPAGLWPPSARGARKRRRRRRRMSPTRRPIPSAPRAPCGPSTLWAILEEGKLVQGKAYRFHQHGCAFCGERETMCFKDFGKAGANSPAARAHTARSGGVLGLSLDHAYTQKNFPPPPFFTPPGH